MLPASGRRTMSPPLPRPPSTLLGGPPPPKNSRNSQHISSGLPRTQSSCVNANRREQLASKRKTAATGVESA